LIIKCKLKVVFEAKTTFFLYNIPSERGINSFRNDPIKPQEEYANIHMLRSKPAKF
jgi:hypothetical protein